MLFENVIWGVTKMFCNEDRKEDDIFLEFGCSTWPEEEMKKDEVICWRYFGLSLLDRFYDFHNWMQAPKEVRMYFYIYIYN